MNKVAKKVKLEEVLKPLGIVFHNILYLAQVTNRGKNGNLCDFFKSIFYEISTPPPQLIHLCKIDCDFRYHDKVYLSVITHQQWEWSEHQISLSSP